MPHWEQIPATPSDLTIPGTLLGAAVTILVAMTLHPLQFAAVQIMEGYWGLNPAALRLTDLRVRSYTVRFSALAESEQDAMAELPDPKSRFPPTSKQLQWAWRRQEVLRALNEFPEDEQDMMPTRLGNILRRYERRAGRPYGISVVLLASHLGLVAPKEQVDYLQDQRTQMDLAVRLTVTSAILALAVTLMFSLSGWWALLALVPLIGAMAFYRGACVVAHHYGNALETVLDLNRRRVYEGLNLPIPQSLAEERAQNALLDQVLRRNGAVNLRLERD